MKEGCIVVRGGGDIATGTIHRLWKSGFKVLVLEIEYPAAIRRQVSVCEAVYQGTALVEGMTAVRIKDVREVDSVWQAGNIPVIVDPTGKSIDELKPDVVIDAILAKKNLGTTGDMAPLTIALGPGFVAGQDVDYVIETSRGHNLGRIISEGPAKPNTGIPGVIAGYSKERVIHAPGEGIMRNAAHIGDVVSKGQVIGWIEQTNGEKIPVEATIPGVIRGLIRDAYPVTAGFKISDIDPRESELNNCFTISDKARCIAGSVLELVCGYWMKEKED